VEPLGHTLAASLLNQAPTLWSVLPAALLAPATGAVGGNHRSDEVNENTPVDAVTAVNLNRLLSQVTVSLVDGTPRIGGNRVVDDNGDVVLGCNGALREVVA
jgi:hypothetical protein